MKVEVARAGDILIDITRAIQVSQKKVYKLIVYK